MTTARIDLKKSLDSYRARHGEFRIVQIPAQQYLMIDGHGDPNASVEYSSAIEALYPLAYGLRSASRSSLDRDYTVMPLEGLWWADEYSVFTTSRDKSRWSWTLMILQPDWIDAAMFADTVGAASVKRPHGRFHDVRLGRLDEGLCVQTLHIGSFDDEGPVLARMHDEFIPQHGLAPTGVHHEIYFSDPRRSDPAKQRTILRQPVAAESKQPVS